MRASDRDREAALALLRARCAQGYLSVDTFERRVERTFAARTVGELRSVMADLTAERSRVRRTLSRFGRSPVPATDAIAVALPDAGAGQWVAIDVGSLNGTWLANRRVARALVVPGDELWLGSCPVRLD